MESAGVPPGWHLVHIGFEGDDAQVSGAHIWSVSWGKAEGRIVVAHPQYPDQRHPMWIYRVTITGQETVFAAGEFSNGVWGLFAPDAAAL